MTRICLALACALCGLACSSDIRYACRFASNFTPQNHTVSVLGVYKDGQMSSEAWGELGPRVSAALGGRMCEAAYGGASLSSDAALSSAIADFVRENGPTDGLLAQLAPAAQGDLIFVLIVAGKLPAHQTSLVPDAPAPPVGGGRNMGPGRGGMSQSGRGSGSRPRRDESVLQLSASLFSVSQKQTVGVVDMEYSGESVDEAVAKFVQRLGQAVPSTTCSSWNWSGTVSPEPIRKLMLEP